MKRACNDCDTTRNVKEYKVGKMMIPFPFCTKCAKKRGLI